MKVLNAWARTMRCSECRAEIEIVSSDIRYRFARGGPGDKEYGVFCGFCAEFILVPDLPPYQKRQATSYSIPKPIEQMVAEDGPTKTTYREARMGADMSLPWNNQHPIVGLDNPSPV